MEEEGWCRKNREEIRAEEEGGNSDRQDVLKEEGYTGR